MRKNWSVPDIKFSRSKFSLDHSVKTTLNVGYLYPLDIIEVLPGDSIKCKLTAVCRATSAFIKPVIDNLDLELYHFFVPLRLCQDDAEEIFGVANPSAYTVNNRSHAAVITVNSYNQSGTIADYLGLPIGAIPPGISVLPFRAFALIYNEWFRNENITQEVFVYKTNTPNASELINSNPFSAANYTGLPPKVCKRRDYFTSCLPQPQKGPAIDLPLGASAKLVTGPKYPVQNGSGNASYFGYGAFPSDSSIHRLVNYTVTPSTDVPDVYQEIAASSNPISTGAPYYTNIYADLSQATAATVNDVRLAFQLQKMLERDALFGTSYREYLRGHFGVISPDARLQYTEFLGGGKIPISVTQVAQTSGTDSDPQSTTSAQGTVAGYSFTNGYSRFSKGFTEHGYVLTVGCLRQRHTYSQGVPKMFTRSNREDFYDPLLANIGEQPVYVSEIYASNQAAINSNVFGYQEAFAEYRHLFNKVTGKMRPNVLNNFKEWAFSDNYANAPSLNSQFIEEGPELVDNALALKSTAGINQFLLDLFFDMPAIRVLPAYSMPGLIDHH